MFKEEKFLEKNIKKIQEYKKNGYNNYEQIELKFWEWITTIFFRIEEKIKTKKNKSLFKEWFIKELNELYKDWISPTEYWKLQKKINELSWNNLNKFLKEIAIKWNKKIIKIKIHNIESNIIKEKINFFLHNYLNNSELKKHYKKAVLGIKWNISRYKFISQEVNKELKIDNWIKKYLQLFLPWLITVESKYNNSSYNKISWAFSMFQFTDRTFINQLIKWNLEKNKYLTEEDKKIIKKLKNMKFNQIIKDINYKKLKKSFKLSMKKLTISAILELEYIYEKLFYIIKKNKGKFEKYKVNTIDKISKKFNLNNEEKNKLIALLIINSYNSWVERIRILLLEFFKKHNNKEINKKYTALELFNKIRSFWLQNKTNWYWKDSAEYVLKVIAWYKALRILELESKKNKKRKH